MSATLQDVANNNFDYVIIGGGTAGLTLAARLAEDPGLSIAVLEAGSAHFNDPLIKVPAQFGKQFGNPEYDWFFMTTPQSHSNGGVYLWPRGKMLGGSSAVNFMAWNKPPSQDIDAWEKLGNPGWNWERLSEYTKRVEKFVPPKKDIAEKNKQLFKAEGHGYDGPLITSFPELIAAAEVPIQETLMKAGIPIAKDPLNGDPIGSSMAINTLDPTDCTRTDAMTAYYLPNKDKPNLKVLCNALVHRIISEKDGAEVKAIGVLFEHSGALHTVLIGKEVILSAGALKSPQILELSGIGSSELLKSLGIQPILNLPGVGTNVQEHISCMVTFELDSKHGIETLDALEDPEYAAKHLALHAEGEGLYRMGLSGFSVVPLSSLSTPEFAKELIVKQRSRIEEKIKSGSLAPGLKEQYEIQLEELEKQRGGDVELTCFPKWFFGAIEKGKGYIMVVSVLNHPFSRGTVHIKSSDPKVQPDMDPHYFEEEFDLDLIATSLKFVRKMPEIEPFKSLVAKEVAPGPSVTTDGQLKDYIKKSLNTTFHTLGTLSMLPREHNGVVDPRLLVYGTKNIRVADLSIVPLQLAAHTQAVAFAIGEVAADILKGTI